MRIDTCICTMTSFKALVERARREGWSFDELMEKTGCCQGCGLCRPYLRQAMKTGQFVFNKVIPDTPDDAAA